jgi:hypothetical protein
MTGVGSAINTEGTKLKTHAITTRVLKTDAKKQPVQLFQGMDETSWAEFLEIMFGGKLPERWQKCIDRDGDYVAH